MAQPFNPRWPNATKAELKQASNGELCPNCKGTSVKRVGSAPDGFNINAAYDCLDCNTQWEGN